MPWLVLGGGITGLLTGLGLQVWVSAIAYPMNIGGRPYLSWPMFVPVTFELTILFAAFAAVFGMFILNGLPMPYHPVFNVARFTSTPAGTGSSWRSKPSIRSSIGRRRGRSCRGSGRRK